MFWLMTCRHHRGEAADALRQAHRDAHRAHVASGGGGVARVLIGSALTADDGETPIGNFGILDAPDREAALTFARSDPYNLAGLINHIELIALASRFQADRIDPMTR